MLCILTKQSLLINALSIGEGVTWVLEPEYAFRNVVRQWLTAAARM